MTRDYQRLQEQDRIDARRLAYHLSAPLHHCTSTPQCKDATQCPMCSNAARLAVQDYRPTVEKRTVGTFVDHFGAGCTLPHPGDDS